MVNSRAHFAHGQAFSARFARLRPSASCIKPTIFARSDDASRWRRGIPLLIPRRHVVSLLDVTVVEWVELGQLLVETSAALRSEFQPDGFNIGVNDGAAAGQDREALVRASDSALSRRSPDPRGGVRWVLPEKAKYWP